MRLRCIVILRQNERYSNHDIRNPLNVGLGLTVLTGYNVLHKIFPRTFTPTTKSEDAMPKEAATSASGAAPAASQSVQISMADMHAAVWGLAEARDDGTRFIPTRDIVFWIHDQIGVTREIAAFYVTRWIGDGVARKAHNPPGFLLLRSPNALAKKADAAHQTNGAGNAESATGAGTVTWQRVLGYLITKTSSSRKGTFPATVRDPLRMLMGKWPRMTHDRAVALLQEIVANGFGERGEETQDTLALILTKPLREPPAVPPPSPASLPDAPSEATPAVLAVASEVPAPSAPTPQEADTPSKEDPPKEPPRLAQPRTGRRSAALILEARILLEDRLGDLATILWLARQEPPGAKAPHVFKPLELLHTHPASGALSATERQRAMQKMEERRWLVRVPRTYRYVLGYTPTEEEIVRVTARMAPLPVVTQPVSTPNAVSTSSHIVEELESQLTELERMVQERIREIRQAIERLKH
jgi:hypothetical protein